MDVNLNMNNNRVNNRITKKVRNNLDKILKFNSCVHDS